jgi:hypothetical protein
VTLNFIGACPQESAELALARWLVYVLSMSLELLDPFKISLASCAGRFHFHLGAHTTVTVVSGILDNWTFSSSQRLSLGHIQLICTRITESLTGLAW